MTRQEQILTELRGQLLAFELARPRSRQREIGASQIHSCTAAAMFRLSGEPESDPRLSWPAFVGSAIHARLEQAIPGVNERRFTYRGVPATVDHIADGLLVDYKTADRMPDKAKDSWYGQVMVGAAGAREAGVAVGECAVICLPRSGDLDAARVYGPWLFDQSAADTAADWVARVESLAADRVDPREHREQPPMFCRDFCPYVTTCRGETHPVQPLDAAVEKVAAEYVEAQAARDAAEERMADARAQLKGLSGQAGDYRITTSGGRPKAAEILDVDALTEWWRFSLDEPVPFQLVEKTTPIRLTVKQVPS